MKRRGFETRHMIVDSALQLFSVKGYHNTSVSDILAATGLTKGGLYGHFASKEELWEEAYKRAVEIWRGIVFRGAGSASDPLERIVRVIENDLRDYVGARVLDQAIRQLRQYLDGWRASSSAETAAPLRREAGAVLG